jgi:hypothetical protein
MGIELSDKGNLMQILGSDQEALKHFEESI